MSTYVAAFSPDRRMLATGGNASGISLWDIASARETRQLRGHTSMVARLAYTPDGKILASGNPDGVISLWNTALGTELLPATGHQDSVESIAVSPNGRLLASASLDRTVRLWDLTTAKVAGNGGYNITGTFYLAGGLADLQGNGDASIASQVVALLMKSGGNGVTAINWSAPATAPTRVISLVE
jgi:WD40 repeat protein